MTKPQLPNCNKLLPSRSSPSTSAIVTTSTSFELASLHARVISIKYTKRYKVNEWVSELKGLPMSGLGSDNKIESSLLLVHANLLINWKIGSSDWGAHDKEDTVQMRLLIFPGNNYRTKDLHFLFSHDLFLQLTPCSNSGFDNNSKHPIRRMQVRDW